MPSTVLDPTVRMPDGESRRGRAPRSSGDRTTLRIPPDLLAEVDRLAEELNTSRNDALLRLARRGTALYREELEIAELREQRWAGVLASYGDDDPDEGEPLPPEEVYEAIMSARADLLDLPPD
jgi:predicted transcriptional regulator